MDQEEMGVLSSILQGAIIDTVYQPIVSLAEDRVLGVEALSRPRHPLTGAVLSPERLFDVAAQTGQSLDLDRLCRGLALDRFRASPFYDSDLLLFLNLDTSILTSSTVGSGKFWDSVAAVGLPPDRVVIEILESNVEDGELLRRFASTYRERGFLIALDDVGMGHSNVDRIHDLKPDLIKLDRTLIAGIDVDYRKQELFDAMVKLAGKLGIVVIAEGIETEPEAMACMERGADLVQGFLFGRPSALDEAAFSAYADQARHVSGLYKQYEAERKSQRRRLLAGYERIVNLMTSNLASCEGDVLDQVLRRSLDQMPEVECAYVLDASGVQVSSTVFNPSRPAPQRTKLFVPSSVGSDLGSKAYFLGLDGPANHFISEPYVSRATGSVCVTISKMVNLGCGDAQVLCMDIIS